MKKILIVFGTRPEAIKMAPLVKEFQKDSNFFETKVCVTAQHREMLDQVLNLFEIIPDYDLNVMKTQQDLFSITSDVIYGMKKVLLDFEPHIVLVHGDTSTTFAASLSAFFFKIKVGHVEAGLRTGNLYSPWPEEANRKLTTQLTDYFYAPTELSKENLLKENITSKKIVVTGNTVIDALLMVIKKINSDKKLETEIVNNINSFSYKFDETRKFILVTGHRRENHGDGFINICNGLKKIALNFPKFDIIYPVHLNPNVQTPVKKILAGIKNIHLIEPLDYQSFVYLMNKSFFIITDSGGIQEEAPSLGKPVLVLRDTTERPEALLAGTVKLVGTNENLIFTEAKKLISDEKYYQSMAKAKNPYGNGKSSIMIVNHLKQF